ncbi:MAG: hypothetical protein UX75_C0009G0009 [Candidatus Moranbacteria bacterium GW2011_GWE2_47_10]|nr:MAG: hypothetical protein UX75_C0009G0009 [Candidatus Moranbacteria bacterium GW2011_GWE2_47_10]HBP01559.1 hypothetical protein [Candidatus Moranbacteria bacterium]
MEIENEAIKEVGNSLVVYSKFNGDISKAVQRDMVISDIRLENRVLVDGGMYIASVSDLDLHTSGFRGFLYLAFYQEMDDAVEKNTQLLSVLILNKLFRRGVIEPSMVYEGKNYQLAWRLWSGERCAHWLILGRDAGKDAIGEMKVRLVEKQKLLFSNDFLSVLFNPVLDALREVHLELGRF